MGVIKFNYYLDPDIYQDIESEVGTITEHLFISIVNNEIITLYFQATLQSPPVGYSSYTTNLGSVAAGANALYPYSFIRVLPTLVTGELNESLIMRITAYTDAGYTQAYGSQNLAVTMHWFDHTDPSWTLIAHDTFSSTVEGWTSDPANVGWWGITSDHYLSAPNSLYIANTRLNIWKVYNTLGKNRVRIVTHHYSGITSNTGIQVSLDGIIIIPTLVGALLLPNARWYRLSLNGTISATMTLMFRSTNAYLYIDEVWVIAK